MTERERWTVYPLLLLSLGISLRSKITQSLDLHEISCSTLRCNHIVGHDPETACQTLLCDHIAATDAGMQRLKAQEVDVRRCVAQEGDMRRCVAQEVDVFGPDGKVRLILKAESPKVGGGGAVAVLSAEGKPEVVLRALPEGGVVEVGGVVLVVDPEAKLVRTLGVGVDEVRPSKAPEPPSEGTDQEPGDDAQGNSQAEKPEMPAAPDKSAQEPSDGKPAGEPKADKPATESDGKPAEPPSEP
jgi:hypothetical protein